MDVNDASRVISACHNLEYYLTSQIMLLESSIMLLESSTMLLEKNFSAGVTQDNYHKKQVICLSSRQLGRIFNFRSGRAHAVHLYFYKLKLPSLKLKKLVQTTFRFSPITYFMVLVLVDFLIALFYVTINIFKCQILCFQMSIISAMPRCINFVECYLLLKCSII